jgi:hypothetical protein
VGAPEDAHPEDDRAAAVIPRITIVSRWLETIARDPDKTTALSWRGFSLGLVILCPIRKSQRKFWLRSAKQHGEIV